MKRRHFLGIAAAGAAGAVLPAALARPETVEEVLITPRLLSILRSSQVLDQIGERYRQLVPGENDPALLKRTLLGSSGEALAASQSAAKLRAHLDAQVRRDFDAGKTVTLQGWVLSVTEARQCALWSLQAA